MPPIPNPLRVGYAEDRPLECPDLPTTFLVVGSRNDEDYGEYSDIDMAFGPGRYSRAKSWSYQHKDGTPY